jgi:hypothetical protein
VAPTSLGWIDGRGIDEMEGTGRIDDLGVSWGSWRPDFEVVRGGDAEMYATKACK